MTTYPILSIIVPTRNRAQYAIPCIRSILAVPSKVFELVVQDNSDDGETAQSIGDMIKDERLVYRYVAERLDVIENFSRGLDASSGYYIAFIGDDDGINPELIDAAVWAKDNGVDALVTTRPAQYRWPDKKDRIFGYEQAGDLTIKPFTGKIEKGDAELALRCCARTAGENIKALPKIYYGLALRDHMKAIKIKAKCYFPGLSPDLAGAIALANISKKFWIVDYPLFIPGASAAGVAGWIASGRHQGRLEDYPHLPKDRIQLWSDLVPKFFSGTTIWGEDTVQALNAVGRKDILSLFNVPLLHAKCAVFNPQYMRFVMKNFYPAMKVQKVNPVIGTASFAYHFMRLWLVRFKFLIYNLLHIYIGDKVDTFKALTDIGEAADTLRDYIAKTGRSFKHYVLK